MNLLRSHLSPLAAYVVLAYVLSWVLWVPAVLWFPDVSSPPWWAIVLVFVGIYGPSVAAIAAAAVHGGRIEVSVLFAKLWRWRVGWSWYGLVLLGPPAFVWIGAGIHKALGGTVGVSEIEWPLRATLVLATYVPFGPLGEELGWRGYALPHLETYLSPLASSVILGIIWAVWHVPMFWFSPIGLPARSLSTIGMWIVSVLSFSILLSYVARNTNYSVPIAILLHATLNAGSAMGFAALAVSTLDAEEIRSWARLVYWLVVLAAAIALARDRRDSRAVVA